MTERRFKPLAMLLPVIALLMALCGCLGRSQPPRFYLMTPISSIPAEGTAAGIKEGLRIGVGPIFIPTPGATLCALEHPEGRDQILKPPVGAGSNESLLMITSSNLSTLLASSTL